MKPSEFLQYKGANRIEDGVLHTDNDAYYIQQLPLESLLNEYARIQKQELVNYLIGAFKELSGDYKHSIQPIRLCELEAKLETKFNVET